MKKFEFVDMAEVPCPTPGCEVAHLVCAAPGKFLSDDQLVHCMGCATLFQVRLEYGGDAKTISVYGQVVLSPEEWHARMEQWEKEKCPN